ILEEKRSRMMEIFFETKDVCQLKDIEKIAPKSKGITPMSELERQHEDGNQRKKALQQAVDKAKVGREVNVRRDLLKELTALKHQRDQLKAELEKYKECDPEVVEEIRKANITAKEAVSRWTDNVFAIKSWAKKKFGLENSSLDKAFGIPEDFDYIN
uniref:Meiotic nuclear divisions 1 homolog (S. cerevisiae) n=1 Tax=Sinocyclocheilus anshuiensis TaxID=1608454 RepID=A0A671K7A7_9TELE